MYSTTIGARSFKEYKQCHSTHFSVNNCIFQLIIYVFNILTLLDGQMDKLRGIKMIAPTVKQLATHEYVWKSTVYRDTLQIDSSFFRSACIIL